jgi:hypothetical protein
MTTTTEQPAVADRPRVIHTGDAPEQPAVEASRPSFTITDAATACGVSRKTITRKLGDLAEHGAAKDDDGIWRIPVEALLAAGLHPGRSLPQVTRPSRAAASPEAAPAATPPAPAPAVAPDVVTIPRDRWDDMRIRLARAEAEAGERALALADARLALRALTAGPAWSPVGAGAAAGGVQSSHAGMVAPDDHGGATTYRAPAPAPAPTPAPAATAEAPVAPAAVTTPVATSAVTTPVATSAVTTPVATSVPGAIALGSGAPTMPQSGTGVDAQRRDEAGPEMQDAPAPSEAPEGDSTQRPRRRRWWHSR